VLDRRASRREDAKGISTRAFRSSTGAHVIDAGGTARVDVGLPELNCVPDWRHENVGNRLVCQWIGRNLMM
jgi:hypothetical protein